MWPCTHSIPSHGGIHQERMQTCKVNIAVAYQSDLYEVGIRTVEESNKTGLLNKEVFQLYLLKATCRYQWHAVTSSGTLGHYQFFDILCKP